MTKMSENISFLYSLIQENDLNHKCLESNLKYIEETELLNTLNSSIKQNELISFINTKLHSSGKERCKAIYLLEKLLPHCAPDTFSNFALTWMQQCCRWNPGTINEELNVLSILIDKSVSNPEVKKQVCSDIIPRFANRLILVQDNICKLTTKLKLKCLSSIIDLYSNVCNAYRNDFQKYVNHCLEQHSDVKQIVKQASVCFVLLCQCYNKGQQGINYKEAWSSQFNTLIDTGNKLFSILYSSVDDSILVSSAVTERVIPGFLVLSEMYEKNPIMRFYGWKTKFAVISKLIQSMLLCKYPVSKSFQPPNLFNLICRFLSINENVLKKCSQTNDIIALNANLSYMHEYAFDILHALILSAKRNLIPYGTLICKLCLQALKWTQSDQSCSSKPFRSLRCKVYTVLSSWLSVSASSSSIEIFADEIIPIAVSDIECIKPVVKLEVNLKPTKKNKRKRQQSNSEMSLQSNSETTSKIVYSEMCINAHRMLQLLISNASVLIRWEHHKKLQYTVVPLLMEILNTTPGPHYPQLYMNAECRLQLFKTLFILTTEPHQKWKTLTSLTSKILDSGTNDCNNKISKFCRYALNQLEIVIHPRGPTLTFPIQMDQDTSTSNTTDKFAKIATALRNQIDMHPTTPFGEEITRDKSNAPVAENVKTVKKTAASPENLANYATKNNAVPVESSDRCQDSVASKDRTGAAVNRSFRDGEQCEKPEKLTNSATKNDDVPVESSDRCQDSAVSEDRTAVADDRNSRDSEQCEKPRQLDEIFDTSDDGFPNKKLKIAKSVPPCDGNENVDITNMLNDFVDTLQ